MKLKKVLMGKKRTLIVAVTVIIALAGLAYAILPSKSTNGDIGKELRDILQLNDAQDDVVTSESTLGFTVKHHSTQMIVSGYVFESQDSDNVYILKGQELTEPNRYAQFYFYPRDNSYLDGLPASARIAAADATQLVATTINLDEWRKSPSEGLESDLDKITARFAPKAASSYQTVTATDTSEEKIGSTDYRLTEYEIVDTQFITTKSKAFVYATLVNDRPYAFVAYVTDTTETKWLPEFKQIISDVVYTSPELDKAPVITSDTKGSQSSAALDGILSDNKVVLSSGSVISKETAMLVAKNTPAVVRVGTATCQDVTLYLPDGSAHSEYKDSCAAGSGSGSILSSDGYISTNGHVTTLPPSSALLTKLFYSQDSKVFTDYFNYLVASGKASVSELRAAVTALENEDQTLILKLLQTVSSLPASQIKATNVRNSFAIQLSDEPIKLTMTDISAKFTFDENVVEAKLIDQNFDVSAEVEGKFDLGTYTGTDVALLKVDKTNLPVIIVGETNSLKIGGSITIIGFPAFVDGGLATKQAKTVASATHGSLLQLFTPKSSVHRLISTDTPSAQGNSGGPGFDESSRMVGLLTYGGGTTNDASAGVTKYSNDGVLRDAEDLQELLKKNKITLNVESKISSTWSTAIDNFISSHYKDSIKGFETVAKEYGQNYLAAKFIESANENIAAGKDKSGKSSGMGALLILAFVGLVIIATVVVVVLIVLRKKRKGDAAQNTPQQFNAPNTGTPQPLQPQNTAQNPFQASVSPTPVPAPTPVQTPAPTPNTYQPQTIQPTVAVTPALEQAPQPQVITPQPQTQPTPPQVVNPSVDTGLGPDIRNPE